MRNRITPGGICLALLLLGGVSLGAEDPTGSVQGLVRLPRKLPSWHLGPLVVFLESLDKDFIPPVPEEIPVIHQKNAKFSPSFLVVAAGQTVEMPNDDRILHNVFSYSRPNDFDLGIYKKGETRRVTLVKPGLVRIYCSIHESMNGSILVTPTPYFATVNSNGRFDIRDVPPGRYRIKIWNERLPEVHQEVTIIAGESLETELEIKFSKSASRRISPQKDS